MHFDKVIIGSSPVCLLEAIYANSKGINTCIIDNAPELGGAWKKLNTPAGKIKDVEIGCHIIEKDKKVFNFFKNKLNLELKEISPSPKIIFRSRSLPYNWKNFLFIIRNIKKFFTDTDGGKLFIYNIGIFLKEIIQINLRYYTFSKGSIDLTEKLIREINQRNMSAKASTNIVSVNVNITNHTIELTSEKGEIITTKKLVISNNSNFNAILIDGKEKTNVLQRRKTEFNHLHLLISDSGMKKLSYWRIFNNEIIHRVSDMTDQIAVKKDEHLICVGVFSSFQENKNEGEITEYIINELKKLELLSDKCEVIKAELSSYVCYYSNFYHLQQLEIETDKMIEILDTRDISVCIRKNLPKYNSVIYI